MKLKLFQLISYRSCQNTKFDLNDELTGLIGVNGSGKSNILNGILLLRKMCRSRYPSFLNDSSFNSCQIRAEIEKDDITIKLKGKITFETDDRNDDEIMFSDLKWKFSHFKKDEWISIPLELLFLNNPSHRIFFPPRSSIKHKISKRIFNVDHSPYNDKNFTDKIAPLLMEIISFFGEVNYYSASRFSDPSRCPVSIELEENRPIRRHRPSDGHEQFLFDLYNSYKVDNKEYKRYLSSVNKEGIGLIDEISFQTLPMPSSSYKVQSGGKIKEIKRERILIVPNITVDGKKLSPNQLSEGTFKTLALLYYILTDKSRLLLIEEPEVCIHHGLLDSIMTLIIFQAKQKQIVMSTHSDYILDHLKPDNLLLIKNTTAKGTLALKLNKTMSKSNYTALKDYLQKSGNLGEYWREGGFDHE